MSGHESLASHDPNHDGSEQESGGSPSVRDVWCIVVAGGSGARFGSRKQFADLAGQRVIDRSVVTAAHACEGVVVVVPQDLIDDDAAKIEAATAVVAGGASRSESVRAGLERVPSSARWVLVHDAARPMATRDIYERVISELRRGAVAVVPAVPVPDTLRSLNGGTIDRESVRAVQTPQGFEAQALRSAHAAGVEGTDDAGLVEATGVKVLLVDGEAANIKLTQPADLIIASALIRDH